MEALSPKGSEPRDKLWVFCLGPAIAMMLGWGLRGFIGGGPLGAMIPGAMVALLLCLILRLDERTSAIQAAVGAIGVGLGGQMTYGQTIGFIVQPESFAWGLLGLSVKGGVWGLSGGAMLGLGFVLHRSPRRVFVIGLLAMLVGVIAGWQLINEPKLIYFSNRHDRPRAEIWAGLLVGSLALLGWLAIKGQARLPLRFALWGAFGGAVGFGGGGLWMVAGQALPDLKAWASWWKFMEFTFGFCFGLTLGIAAWLNRTAIRAAQPSPPADTIRHPSAALVIVPTIALALAVLWSESSIDVVCNFTFFGIALLLLCLFVESFAWQVGMTLTIAAFVYDLLEKYHEGPGWVGPNVKWLAATFASIAVAAMLAQRLRRGRPMVVWSFLVLTWSAVFVSYLKSVRELPFSASHMIVELVFSVSAIWLTWLVARGLKDRAPESRTMAATASNS